MLTLKRNSFSFENFSLILVPPCLGAPPGATGERVQRQSLQDKHHPPKQGTQTHHSLRALRPHHLHHFGVTGVNQVQGERSSNCCSHLPSPRPPHLLPAAIRYAEGPPTPAAHGQEAICSSAICNSLLLASFVFLHCSGFFHSIISWNIIYRRLYTQTLPDDPPTPAWLKLFNSAHKCLQWLITPLEGHPERIDVGAGTKTPFLSYLSKKIKKKKKELAFLGLKMQVSRGDTKLRLGFLMPGE